MSTTSTESAPSTSQKIEKTSSLFRQRVTNGLAAGALALVTAGTVYGAVELEPYFFAKDAETQQNVFCQQTEVAPVSCENSHIQNVAGEFATPFAGLVIAGLSGFAAYQFGSRALRP